VQENLADLRLGAPDTVEKHGEIRTQVESVKGQQHSVMEQLRHEQICLEHDLKLGIIKYKHMSDIQGT